MAAIGVHGGSDAPLVSLADFSVGIGAVTVVDRLNLSIAAGEVVALVGESGAGKSLTALGLMGLLPPGGWSRGSFRLDGDRVDPMDGTAMGTRRGKDLGLVFQDADAALDPMMRVGAQLVETLRHHGGLDRGEARRAAAALLSSVGFADADTWLDRYPFEFSGGMRQRAAIALTLACAPRLLIADEPTSALDAVLRADVLALIVDQARARGMALLLISHDLDSVAAHADRVAVLYAGRLVEAGRTAPVLAAPRHPYTRALADGRLDGNRAAKTLLPTLPGRAPRAGDDPRGCRFHPRCPVVLPRCAQDAPPWSGAVDDGCACWQRATP